MYLFKTSHWGLRLINTVKRQIAVLYIATDEDNSTV